LRMGAILSLVSRAWVKPRLRVCWAIIGLIVRLELVFSGQIESNRRKDK